MPIKFLDLNRIHQPIKNEIVEELSNIIDTNGYILSDKVEEFENNFSNHHQAKFGVGISSGTSALELSLRALGIGQGDEVILPANTFIATASAVTFTGAKPVLADCDDCYNIDVTQIRNRITSRTKAILPVHLYGQPADTEEIIEIAKDYDLDVIEDSCQAHGAKYKEKPVGTLGKISAFSFYPGKNLGAMGDGGIALTNSQELADKLKFLRNYGQTQKYHHEFPGYNKRLDAIQAAILNIKLKHLDQWNKERQQAAKLYNEQLANLPQLTLPKTKPDRSHVYHLFVIQTQDRDKLAEFLNSKGIDSGLHYPIPIHLQKSYSYLNHKKGDFPNAEKFANQILSLPIFPGITTEEVTTVCKAIKEFYS